MQYGHWAIVVIIVGIGIYVLYQWNKLVPSVRRLLMGVMLALSVFYMVPVTAVNMNNMTKVNFCLQCHSMETYGKNLRIDDEELVSAIHYQNNYVPHEKACYTCHSDYTFFGPVKAKINGLKHLWVQYTGQTPKEIKLYSPYDFKNCLQCHQGRNFKAVSKHTQDDNLPKIMSGQMSCNTTDCHQKIHTKELEDAEFVNEEELPGAYDASK